MGSLIMSIVLVSVRNFSFSNLLTLILQGFSGIIVYFLVLYFCRDALLMELFSKVRK